MLRHVKHPFPAVIDKGCHTLILGSVPSVKSVEGNFYYMHPRNRFWKVLSAIFGKDLYGASIEERKSFLLSRGIALYDSVEECDIESSKDSAIFNVVPADVPSLILQADIRRILCNGKASYNYLVSAYPELKSMAISLPSTSPANAAISLEELVTIWQSALS